MDLTVAAFTKLYNNDSMYVQNDYNFVLNKSINP